MRRLTDRADTACSNCSGVIYCNVACERVEFYEKLKYYENAEEEGRMIILPVTKEEEIKTMYIPKENRPAIGRQMDNYLRDNIQNEEIFWTVWAAMGMPDGADDEDFEQLKHDDHFWTCCLEAFMRSVLRDADNH